MYVQCKNCEGYGQTISDRSLRQGHTHSNDPDRIDDPCAECNGEGLVPATADDLDGKRARYRFATGHLFIYKGTLALEDECGALVVNLQPDDVEVLDA